MSKIIETLPLFSEPFSIGRLDVDQKNILKYLKTISYKPRTPTLRKSFDYNILVSDSFKLLDGMPSLKKEIESALTEHIQKVLQYNIDFYIYASWSAKTLPQGYAARHHHANGWLSAVYYPIGHKDFQIRFYPPRMANWHCDKIKEYNIYNSSSWTFTAEDNMLIIFNNLIDHEILCNTSDQDRYSVACNLIPKGKLGEGEWDQHQTIIKDLI